MGKFFIHNGEIEKVSEFKVPANIALGGGDSIRETIRLYNTKPLFLSEHLSNLRDTMDLVNMGYPKDFSLEKISRYILRLLNVNKVYKGGVCKIVVYRNADVFERINANNINFALFIEALPQLEFDFNTKGLRLKLIPSVIILKPNLYSMYSAHMFTQNKNVGNIQNSNFDCIGFYNEDGSVFHTSMGDLFFVTKGVFHTPSEVVNSFRHPLSSYIIQELQKLEYVIKEMHVVSNEAILQADEIFLVHPIYGIQWVVKCNNNTYKYTITKTIYSIVGEGLKQIK